MASPVSLRSQERRVERLLKEAKSEEREYKGIDDLSWLSVLIDAHYSVGKEVAASQRAARASFGGCLLFLGIALLWVYALITVTFDPNVKTFARAFAAVSPLVIFLGASGFFLRNSLRFRSELSTSSDRLASLSKIMSAGIAVLDSRENFSRFASEVLFRGTSSEDAGQKEKDDGTDGASSRLLAALLTALGRSATFRGS